jgi:hypothetical protein
MSVAVLGVMVPIVAIIMGIGIGMLALTLNYRRKREMFQLHHAERLAAIEKGIELPPLPPEFFESYRRPPGPANYTYLRRGVMLVLISAVLFVGIEAEDSLQDAWWGLLPGAVGLADLMIYFLVRRRDAGGEGQPAKPRP